MDNTELLFALDIGTRSVVGLVGRFDAGSIKLIATERHEHHTRAMLDGQIHDVREVAQALSIVKARLEAKTGPLFKVAVAAAGRALCTLRAKAELDVSARGALSNEDERTLELAAIQTAQAALATSGAVSEPSDYYCVGHSIVSFTLDEVQLKSLVGQRGKRSGIEVITTFLPRQVIDSLQSALQAVDLEISTITLEPIAAINVLIPSTMRHLNLALVDVGAGTSDVAITKNGSVSGFGMVPFAGDEITEAISQHFLLDFNVAEKVKRQLGSKNKKIVFTDVLGVNHKSSAKPIIDAMASKVAELAQAIAHEILTLNTTAPQAVLLVGGGALTPLLTEALAQALDIPSTRVAIRQPDSIEGITAIPDCLRTPDAVTPLGILKLSSGQSLSFINILVNDRPIRLFNVNRLTVSDALLAAGVDVRALRGRPGMGLTITVDGQTRFLAGSHGTQGQVLLNGEPAKLTDPLSNQDVLAVILGTAGATPAPLLKDIATPSAIDIKVNDKNFSILCPITINGKPASPENLLQDRDQIITRSELKLLEALEYIDCTPKPTVYVYKVNGTERNYKIWPKYTIDGQTVTPTTTVKDGDSIEFSTPPTPLIGEILGITGPDITTTEVSFNGVVCKVPIKRFSILLDGRPSDILSQAPSGSLIDFSMTPDRLPTISDVLLAADFDPRSLPSASRIAVLLNGQQSEYTQVVQSGDQIEMKIENM